MIIALVAIMTVVPPVADAEWAFAEMAQRDGQWTAFRATAASDAVMFVPGMVRAQDWLKGRVDPPKSVRWWPTRTVTSCDFSLALSVGGALWPSGAHGKFTTLWKLQPDSKWRWVLDQGEVVAPPAPPLRPFNPETASCANQDRAVASAPAAPPTLPLIVEGRSKDGTLSWQMRGNATTGERTLSVWRWTGEAHEIVLNETTAP